MVTNIFEDFDIESQNLLERLHDKMLCFGNRKSGIIEQEMNIDAVLFTEEEIENNLKKRKPCQ